MSSLSLSTRIEFGTLEFENMDLRAELKSSLELETMPHFEKLSFMISAFNSFQISDIHWITFIFCKQTLKIRIIIN